MPTQSQHRAGIPAILKKIEEKVGFPVELYRAITKDGVGMRYFRLELDKSKIDPYAEDWSDAYLYNDARATVFAVAAAGQHLQQRLKDPTLVTTFHIFRFPGLCAAGVSSGTVVYEQFRGKGVNKLGINLRIALAGSCGYTLLFCSDIDENERSVKTILGAGFKPVAGCENRRTKNELKIYVKEL